MLVEIKSDLFNIIKRIKQIDANYYVVFNTRKKRFEVHNGKQSGSTYCLTIPYDFLDFRAVNMVLSSQARFLKQILKIMDEFNKKTEQKLNDAAKLETFLQFEESLRDKSKF